MEVTARAFAGDAGGGEVSAMRSGRFVAVMAVAAWMLTIAPPAQAGPGDLDRSFGTAGVVVFTQHAMRAAEVGIASDGKIVTAGTSAMSGSERVGVARFLATGALDPSFSSDGFATVAWARPVAVADMALQGGRKVVVAATHRSHAPTPADPYAYRTIVALTRLRLDGTADPTFSDDGKLTTAFGANAEALGVALQPDNRIVVLAQLTDATGWPFKIGLVRYTSTGALDPTFGGDGRVTVPFATPLGRGDVALQPDGKIVVVGGEYSADVMRLLPDGSVDRAFGDGGVRSIIPTTIAPDGEYATFTSVVVQPDGKIVVGGLLDSDMCGWQARQALLVRLSPQGFVDPGFGIRLFDTGGDCETAPYEELGFADLALRPDGKVLAVGGYHPAGYVALFRTDGWLATGFGQGGVAALPDPLNDGIDVTVQQDGRIVALSDLIVEESGTGLARLLPA